MKDNYKLVAITVVFVLTGLFLVYVSLGDVELPDNCVFEEESFLVDEEVVDYKEGHDCVCIEGGIIECIPLEVEEYEPEIEVEASVDVDNLNTEGLEFEYNYLAGIGDENGDYLSSTKFSSVSIVDDNLIVVLETSQICPSTNVVFEQEGFYENRDGVIRLYNKVDVEDGSRCVVELKYTLEDFVQKDLDEMGIVFVNEEGLETHASICIYDNSIYSDDDVFKGGNDMICVCEDGEVSCSESLSD